MSNFESTTGILFTHRLMQLGLLKLWNYSVDNNPTKNIPYHNNSHMFYMAWLADRLYQSLPLEEQFRWHPREMICAALFHDFNHSAGAEPDAVNIERALEGWRQAYAAVKPVGLDPVTVEELIRTTQYPYTSPPKGDEAKCLRDADLLYTTVMGNPHIVMHDLRREMETTRGVAISESEMANGYKEFIRKAEIHTEMGKILRLQCFPTFLLSLALRCEGVEVVAPQNAEEWLKG